jgi:hypothetical protein
VSHERKVVSACRYCGATIAWASTEHGKFLPMDFSSVADGEWIKRKQPDGSFLALKFSTLEPAHALEKRYRAHTQTCARRRQRTVDHCQKPGCKGEVRPDAVACWVHASDLPAGLEEKLSRLWREKPGSKEHKAAVLEAVRALGGQEVVSRAT